MDYTTILTKAINDLFTPETPVVLSDPNQRLSDLYVEDDDAAIEVGIEVENIIIDFHGITPPDLDQTLKANMTVGEAVAALATALG